MKNKFFLLLSSAVLQIVFAFFSLFFPLAYACGHGYEKHVCENARHSYTHARGAFYAFYAAKQVKQKNHAMRDINAAVDNSPLKSVENGGVFKPNVALNVNLREAQRLYRNGQAQLSVEVFTKVLQENETNAMALLGRARAHFRLKNYGLAKEDVDKAIALKNNNAQLYALRGRIFTVQQNPTLAIADFSQAIDISPAEGLNYFYRGNLYAAKKWWSLALADYKKSIRHAPYYSEAYLRYGKLYALLGDYRAALGVFEQLYAKQQKHENLMKITPRQRADMHLQRGYAFYALNKGEKAEESYSIALQSNFFKAEAFMGRALLRKSQGKFKLALADYNSVIAVKPYWIAAYFNRANVYRLQKREDAAIADYKKVIELSSATLNNGETPLPTVRLNRARAHFALGEDDLALKDFLLAHEIYEKWGDDFNSARVLKEIENLKNK